MIDEIKVNNLALIIDADMQPASGLTVITGETGAGKTALLESCKLLMGSRADKTMVREGEAEAYVAGRFFFGEAAEEELVVARALTKDGRSRVQINGKLASVSELAEMVAPHIDLCSQHDGTALLKTQTHVSLLDAWAQDSAKIEAYTEALAEAKAAARALERIREAATLSTAQLDQARFVLSQIEAVNPEPNEYEELIEKLTRAENSESLARAANDAHANLSDEGAALDALNSAAAALEEGARLDESLGEQAKTLREAICIAEDVSRETLLYRDSIDFDAATLEQMQERAAAYQSLMRTYGPTVEAVLAAAEEAKRTLSAVDNAAEEEAKAASALAAAEAKLAQAAAELSDARKQAAPKFASEVSAYLAQLEMGSASLLCEVSDLPRENYTQTGPNSVEFMFSPAANMQVRPLARIASGGELSRVMLGLHAVMGERDNTETLVFDEIDAGVGGATALALAEVLYKLSLTHQVIVVTHLPQIAARADKHYVVHKTERDGVAQTFMEEAAGEVRTEEIARMLSGNVTQTSLKHAEELLAK